MARGGKKKRVLLTLCGVLMLGGAALYLIGQRPCGASIAREMSIYPIFSHEFCMVASEVRHQFFRVDLNAEVTREGALRETVIARVQLRPNHGGPALDDVKGLLVVTYTPEEVHDDISRIDVPCSAQCKLRVADTPGISVGHSKEFELDVTVHRQLMHSQRSSLFEDGGMMNQYYFRFEDLERVGAYVDSIGADRLFGGSFTLEALVPDEVRMPHSRFRPGHYVVRYEARSTPARKVPDFWEVYGARHPNFDARLALPQSITDEYPRDGLFASGERVATHDFVRGGSDWQVSYAYEPATIIDAFPVAMGVLGGILGLAGVMAPPGEHAKDRPPRRPGRRRVSRVPRRT